MWILGSLDSLELLADAQDEGPQRGISRRSRWGLGVGDGI
jgi:hypothetical protein